MGVIGGEADRFDGQSPVGTVVVHADEQLACFQASCEIEQTVRQRQDSECRGLRRGEG